MLQALREETVLSETITDKSLASLTTASNTQPFLAQSPPAWDVNFPTPQNISSPLSLAAAQKAPTLPTRVKGEPVEQVHSPQIPTQSAPVSTTIPSEPAKDNYVSKIGILASSIPYYHNQYMQQYKVNKQAAREARSQQGEALEPHEHQYFSKLAPDTDPREQTPEEQATTARRLKPHSRSTLQLQYITSQPREKVEDPSQSSKKSRTKWQFGIRSRNLPHEAIHCVYKALAAQNAQWEVPKPSNVPPNEGPSSYPVHVTGGTSTSETLSRGSNSPEHARHKPPGTERDPTDDYMYNFDFEGKPAGGDTSDASTPSATTTKAEDDDDNVDPSILPENYIPKDPWCIKVRWLKDGMYPPGTIHPSSAHSSRLDLANPADHRRSSTIGSLSSAAPSTSSMGGSIGSLGGAPSSGADGACYVYMDVQLYTVETGNDKGAGTFLVDFKCAGYESVVEQAIGETEKILVGSGHRVLNKDVTSPQPFLDLTNKLVIHLAGGGN